MCTVPPPTQVLIQPSFEGTGAPPSRTTTCGSWSASGTNQLRRHTESSSWKKSSVRRFGPLSSTIVRTPVVVSAHAAAPPPAPLPTMHTSKTSLGSGAMSVMLVIVIRGSRRAQRRRREADPLPTDHVRVAAVDRIGEQRLQREHVQETERLALRERDGELRVGEVGEDRVLARRIEIDERCAVTPLRLAVDD